MKNKLMRLLTSAAFSLIFSVQANAVEELIIFDNDKIVFDCWLTDLPVVTFGEQDGQFGISVKSKELEMFLDKSTFKPVSENLRILLKHHDEDNPELTDIDENSFSSSRTIRFTYIDGETVVIDGVDEMVNLSLFSLSGKAVQTYAEYTSPRLTIHLGHLPKGYYIIKLNEQSFKVYKK